MRSCPKCKTSDYNNRYFTLLINECGHSLCKNCVDTLFVRQSGPCVTCGRNLKKSSYWEQIFDDPLIEKQNFYRKKLVKIFNLKQDDFPTLRAFNDYLEIFETYVNNLAFDVDVEETKRKIEQFQHDNEDLIFKNKNRLSQDEEWIEHCLDEERQVRNEMMTSSNNFATAAPPRELSRDDAKSVIAELMSSDLDASQIVGRRRYEQVRSKQQAALAAALEATEKSAADLASNLPNFKRRKLNNLGSQQIISMSAAEETAGEGEIFVYKESKYEIFGPPLCAVEELEAHGFLQHIKAASGWQMAGGYVESLGCFRALFEAHCGLFA